MPKKPKYTTNSSLIQNYKIIFDYAGSKLPKSYADDKLKLKLLRRRYEAYQDEMAWKSNEKKIIKESRAVDRELTAHVRSFRKIATEENTALYKIVKYEKKLNNALNKDALQLNDIDTMIEMSKSLKNKDLFKQEAKYGIDELFSKLAERDLLRLRCARELTRVGRPLNMTEVMKLDIVDKNVKHEQESLKLKENLEKLEKLSKTFVNTGNIVHRDSAEYRKMKESLTNVLTALKKDINDPEVRSDLGDQLEALQKSSLEYIQAKGVGKQHSMMGKARMKIAAELCINTVDFMDKFPSRERIKNSNDTIDKKIDLREFDKPDIREMNLDEEPVNYNEMSIILDDDMYY